MSCRKSPHLKKQDEYDKDRHVLTEYPTWFRRHWPKKKARLRRKERHKITAIVQNTMRHKDEDLSTALLAAAKPTFHARKWHGSAPTVREIIEHKQKRHPLAGNSALSRDNQN